jgi:CrcB protein
MKQFLIVFIGGGLGSGLRFLVEKIINSNYSFPFSTFIVNMIGCLTIGFLIEYGTRSNLLDQNQKIFLITGLCGGFTTFSAFAHENQLFLKSGDYLLFTAYTFGSIFIGILAVVSGVLLAKQI